MDPRRGGSWELSTWGNEYWKNGRGESGLVKGGRKILSKQLSSGLDTRCAWTQRLFEGGVGGGGVQVVCVWFHKKGKEIHRGKGK